MSLERPFVYEFLDERFQREYVSETRLARIFDLFTDLSILAACPGLSATAGLIAPGFVLVAVSYQSVRAALANPTDALRHE